MKNQEDKQVSIIAENHDHGFALGYIEPIIQQPDNDYCELTLQGKSKNLHIKANMNQLPHLLSLMEGYL
jgi:hypothetical protein